MARNRKKTRRRQDHPIPVEDRVATFYEECGGMGGLAEDRPDPFIGPEIRPAFCRHWRQAVEIEPGVIVYASAYMDRPRDEEWYWPEIGIYLSERWIEEMPMGSFYWAGPTLGPATEVALLPCPDGGWPLYEEDTERVLAYALTAARAGRFVEVGCHAGHGRTGLALAALMILAGFDAEAAILRVWNDYCDLAVETPQQERYLLDLERERRSDVTSDRRICPQTRGSFQC